MLLTVDLSASVSELCQSLAPQWLPQHNLIPMLEQAGKTTWVQGSEDAAHPCSSIQPD